MDKSASAAKIVRMLNQNDDSLTPQIIHDVCEFFDEEKANGLSNADLQFLYYVASKVGIPQYYDMLPHFNKDVPQIPNVNQLVFGYVVQNSSYYVDNDSYLHRYQINVLDHYHHRELNRYFLSASTSFGKTYLVYEIIRKMKYKNIVLMFPTIALMTENLAKIYSNDEYEWIREKYKIHTLSDSKPEGEWNIFLYTPERYLTFIDNNKNISLDFIFVDEIYKLDNGFIIDEESKEDQRDIAYRIALYFALQDAHTDALLAGPYVEIHQTEEGRDKSSLFRFFSKYGIKPLNYNSIELVNKIEQSVYIIKDAKKMFLREVSEILKKNQNAIVYSKSRSDAENKVKQLIKENFSFLNINNTPDEFKEFIEHIKANYPKDHDGRQWIEITALEQGIAIHHGLVPKYIQKEIIDFFNRGIIKILIATTTITEGVNTTAKNVLITSSMKGTKDLKKFDAQNIEGRAGRFMSHYSGNVIILDSNFKKIIESDSEKLEHLYFRKDVEHTSIDFPYTENKYLSDKEKDIYISTRQKQNRLGIPDDIMNMLKALSLDEKLTVYENVANLSDEDKREIKNLILNFNQKKFLDKKLLEIIIKTIAPIAVNSKIDSFIKGRKEDHCYLTGIILSYMKGGLPGMIKYKIDEQKKNINTAIRESTEFVYHILKYQVTKYFGAFNLMYKYYLSKTTNTPFEKVVGIDSVLMKFEYNSYTHNGRIVSDFGVPQKIIDYYEVAEDSKKKQLQKGFDNFERKVFNDVQKIVE
ncbi:superfamily II helicase [Xylanibacter oryzae DSM 17970]|uniref:Superfamily II helicase n=1 Tax=Xylanibacter oryzae DSM 17970 TaxID=915438 RepID=A0ABP3BDK6_9BACT|nr:helicase-related protein [Xylanibacter oryzae]EXG77679.1 superfamily II helicase [Xylanibacter oryzae DSM 17970]